MMVDWPCAIAPVRRIREFTPREGTDDGALSSFRIDHTVVPYNSATS